MSEKLLIRTLRKEIAKRPPFWFMRQAGRYLPEYREIRGKAGGFLDLCFNPELACEVTLQPIRRFNMDAAILFSDILVIPHALGVSVSFVKGEGPKLEAIATPEAINTLSLRDVKSELAKVYEAVGMIRETLADDKALIGFCGAPWTVATYMVEGGSSRDFKKTRELALREPESFKHLIDLLVEASVIHLSAQIEAGADAVQIFDSWAGVLPNVEFQRWCIQPIADITQKLKQLHPDVSVIAFPKGAGLRYPGFAKATGVDAVSCDMTVPPMAMKILTMNTVAQGNLDPLLVAYDKKAMLEQAKQVLDTLQGSPFIFNLGHGFVPETPVENVQALSEFILNYGQE